MIKEKQGLPLSEPPIRDYPLPQRLSHRVLGRIVFGANGREARGPSSDSEDMSSGRERKDCYEYESDDRQGLLVFMAKRTVEELPGFAYLPMRMAVSMRDDGMEEAAEEKGRDESYREDYGDGPQWHGIILSRPLR